MYTKKSANDIISDRREHRNKSDGKEKICQISASNLQRL